MNALDSLFDFAALMSTSSAMTLIPVPNDSNESAQDMKPFKARSTTTAPVQSCQMLHPLQQIDGSMHGLPQIEKPIAVFSRAHIDSGNQHPIDWILAPPFSQGKLMQGQHSLLSEHSRVPAYETPAFDCCSHHLSQPCACNYGFTSSRSYQQDSMVPSAKNDQHMILGQAGPELQYFPGQQPPADVLSHEGHGLGQLLSPHSFYAEDNYDSITPHPAALQHRAFLDGNRLPGNMMGCIQYF